MAAASMQRAARGLTQIILSAEPSRQAADAANRLGLLLQNATTPVVQACREREGELIDSAIELLIADPLLAHRDHYTSFLTALRFATVNKHAANLRILERTSELVGVFSQAFDDEPNGWTAPEFVSMWSSIVNDESSSICRKYLLGVVDQITPCMKSNSVGNIVAALLLSNLVGGSVVVESAIPMVASALQAAFSGQEYAERQWGPGPTSKALANISACPESRQYIIGLVPLLAQSLVMSPGDWPVDGFDQDYYLGAKADAAKTIWNLADSMDVLQACPEVSTALQTAFQQNDARIRRNAAGALFQIARFSAKSSSRPASTDTLVIGTEKDRDTIAMVASHVGASTVQMCFDCKKRPLSPEELTLLGGAGKMIVVLSPKLEKSHRCLAALQYACVVDLSMIGVCVDNFQPTLCAWAQPYLPWLNPMRVSDLLAETK